MLQTPSNKYAFQSNQFGFGCYDDDDDVTMDESSHVTYDVTEFKVTHDDHVMALNRENELKSKDGAGERPRGIPQERSRGIPQDWDRKSNDVYLSSSLDLIANLKNKFNQQVINSTANQSDHINTNWQSNRNSRNEVTLKLGHDLRIEDVARIGSECVKVSQNKVNLIKSNATAQRKPEPLEQRVNQLLARKHLKVDKDRHSRSTGRRTPRRLPQIPDQTPHSLSGTSHSKTARNQGRIPAGGGHPPAPPSSLAAELQAAFQSENLGNDEMAELNRMWFPMTGGGGCAWEQGRTAVRVLGTPDQIDPENKYDYISCGDIVFVTPEGATEAARELLKITETDDECDEVKPAQVWSGCPSRSRLMTSHIDDVTRDESGEREHECRKSCCISSDSEQDEDDQENLKEKLSSERGNTDKMKIELEAEQSRKYNDELSDTKQYGHQTLPEMKINETCETANEVNTFITGYQQFSHEIVKPKPIRPSCLPDLITTSTRVLEENQEPNPAPLDQRNYYSISVMNQSPDEEIEPSQSLDVINFGATRADLGLNKGVVFKIEEVEEGSKAAEESVEEVQIPPRRFKEKVKREVKEEENLTIAQKYLKERKSENIKLPTPVKTSFFTLSGKASPDIYLDETDATHRGCHKFVPRHPEELAIEIGDPIYVDDEADDLWCEGVNLRTQERGVFPTAYATDLSILDGAGAAKKQKYFVKYLGSIEVNHHQGHDVLCHAVNKLVARRQKAPAQYQPPLCSLELDDSGIKMIDRSKKQLPFSRFNAGCTVTEKLSRMLSMEKSGSILTNDHLFSLKNICFCGFHPKNDKYFGFITKHPMDMRFACHVYQREKSTREIVENIGASLQSFYQQYLACVHPTEDIYME